MARRGCYWCGNPGATFPAAFVDDERRPVIMPAVCGLPAVVVTCGWRCNDAMIGWADRLVGDVERAGLRAGY